MASMFRKWSSADSAAGQSVAASSVTTEKLTGETKLSHCMINALVGIRDCLEDWGLDSKNVENMISDKLNRAELNELIPRLEKKRKNDQTESMVPNTNEKKVVHPFARKRTDAIYVDHERGGYTWFFYFDVTISIFIFVNIGFLAYEIDWKARNINVPVPMWFTVVSWILAVIFVLELFVRMYSERMDFVKGPNKWWNCFDAVSSGMTLLEMAAGNGNSALKLLKFVRAVKLFRVLRFLPDLRKMVLGIIGTLVSLFWAMVLLTMIMLVFSIVLTDLVTDMITANVDQEGLSETYGSVFQTFYSLFKAMSGGVDWGDISDPLVNVNSAYFILFAMYISLIVYCVLNVVTAVFVENSKDMCSDEEVRRHERFRDEIQEIFEHADNNQNGAVDIEEFEKVCEDKRIRSWWRQLDLDIDAIGAHELFTLLDRDEGGHVLADELVQGVMQLKGYARSVDLFRLQKEVSSVGRKVNSLTNYCQLRLEALFNGIAPATTVRRNSGPSRKSSVSRSCVSAASRSAAGASAPTASRGKHAASSCRSTEAPLNDAHGLLAISCATDCTRSRGNSLSKSVAEAQSIVNNMGVRPESPTMRNGFNVPLERSSPDAARVGDMFNGYDGNIPDLSHIGDRLVKPTLVSSASPLSQREDWSGNLSPDSGDSYESWSPASDSELTKAQRRLLRRAAGVKQDEDIHNAYKDTLPFGSSAKPDEIAKQVVLLRIAKQRRKIAEPSLFETE